jgi:undecaprenyl diphosphate synthase
MDGNGRWARLRGWARVRGHRAGVRAVRETATTAASLGVEQLTLYAFSTENWKRPQREVDLLFRLLARFLVNERRTLIDNRIRLTTIGEIDALPRSVRRALDETLALSARHDGMRLCLALNYGARNELVAAMRLIATRVARGELDPNTIDEQLLTQMLLANGAGDVDLLIRTGGEQRLSNFLLWQASYAELYFTEVLWPDFRGEDLRAALADFAGRERRFGAVGAALPSNVMQGGGRR